MLDESELLRRFAESHSQEAFSEFVQRKLTLVYGAALRRADGDRELAQDVAQIVFAEVARDARRLSRHPALTGWLYVATRNAAIKAIVSEHRRKRREQAASAMSADRGSEPPIMDWASLRPVIDEALDELEDHDRDALLLRYFDDRTFSQVAAALQTTDEAARKRVDRALEKLRLRFQRRGILCSAVAVAEALAAQPVLTGHAALASSISGSALAITGAPTAIALVTPMKVAVATIGAVLAFGALNIATSRARLALREEVLSEALAQRSALVSAKRENLKLREALDAVRAPPSALFDDSDRMAEMGELIQGGYLGSTSWPLPQVAAGQDDLLAAAESASGILGLTPAQAAAFADVLRGGRARLRSEVASGAEIVRESENNLTISISPSAISAARAAYNGIRTDVEAAIGRDKLSLLDLAGFFKAVDSALGNLGLTAASVAISKSDLVINGRTVAGQHSYKGLYTATEDAFGIRLATNSTFGSSARSGIARILGDELASRIPLDF